MKKDLYLYIPWLTRIWEKFYSVTHIFHGLIREDKHAAFLQKWESFVCLLENRVFTGTKSYLISSKIELRSLNENKIVDFPYFSI